jgi:hypothetical protein
MTIRFCFFIGLTLFIYACGVSKDEQQETVETDIQMLGNFINLDSISPTSVKWIHGRMGNPSRLELGPTDYYVIAIITLSESDFKKLKGQYHSEENIQSKIHLKKDYIRDWFSPTVKACFQGEGEYLATNVPVHRVAALTKLYRNGFVSSQRRMKYSFTSLRRKVKNPVSTIKKPRILSEAPNNFEL